MIENKSTINVKDNSDDVVFKSLKERPKFSITMHIYFTFIFSFIILFGFAITQLITTYKLENKIMFFELSNSYLYEIQQARRYEKNYFLYNTNINDTLYYIELARKILINNAEKFKKALSFEVFQRMQNDFSKYEQAIQILVKVHSNENKLDLKTKINLMELNVRKYGQELVSFAENFQQREKQHANKMISTSRLINILTFVFIFLFFAFNTYFLGLRILKPISRFLKYTQRIGEGDFSPILPRKRYRDEFSKLAIAINKMIKELDKHQKILVESHKLRAVGTLTAGVAHELNNPINNITLTGYMLLEDFAELSEEEKLDMINDIIHEADRSKAIVKNLLDFARESESTVETLDVENVIDETINLARNHINLKGASIKKSISKNLPRVYADKQQLTQVFLNLLINALDVTEKNGLIQIDSSLATDNNFVEVKIIDFGKGIPEHLLSSIFDPFFTTKSKKGGTGLGLSISQGIITKFGGNITVKTELEKGSTFIVSLPAASFPTDFNLVAANNN